MILSLPIAIEAPPAILPPDYRAFHSTDTLGLVRRFDLQQFHSLPESVHPPPNLWWGELDSCPENDQDTCIVPIVASPPHGKLQGENVEIKGPRFFGG